MGWYSDIQVNYLMFSLPYMVTSMQLLGSASLHSTILNISIATLPLLFVSIFIRLTSHFSQLKYQHNPHSSHNKQ